MELMDFLDNMFENPKFCRIWDWALEKFEKFADAFLLWNQKGKVIN